VIAANYPFLDVVWTMLIFFAWVIWFWLLITVFADVFRRDDLSGWGKAGWTVFVIVLPFLGVLIYMISQSKGMTERNLAQQQQAKSEADSYIRSVAQSDPADQIAKAKDLLDSGAISQSEYESIKQKALATA
jgi:putative oligomerization/nucleic acid binding protein/phospholipase D-like protein